MEIIEKQPVKFYSKKDKLGTVSTLKKIKKFLTVKRWIQEAYASDGHFCLIGAAQHIDGTYEDNATEIMHHEAHVRGYESAEDFNDHKRRSYKHIVSFLDKSIQRAEKGLVIATPPEEDYGYN